jgi:hypothetical protein
LPPCPPDWYPPNQAEFEELDRVDLEEHPEVRQRMWGNGTATSRPRCYRLSSKPAVGGSPRSPVLLVTEHERELGVASLAFLVRKRASSQLGSGQGWTGHLRVDPMIKILRNALEVDEP